MENKCNEDGADGQPNAKAVSTCMKQMENY